MHLRCVLLLLLLVCAIAIHAAEDQGLLAAMDVLKQLEEEANKARAPYSLSVASSRQTVAASTRSSRPAGGAAVRSHRKSSKAVYSIHANFTASGRKIKVSNDSSFKLQDNSSTTNRLYVDQANTSSHIVNTTLGEQPMTPGYRSAALFPDCYGRKSGAAFTQYWIPKENEWDEANNGRRLYLSNTPEVPLLTEKNDTIKMVSRTMHEKCLMEGTCLLETGAVVNLAEKANRFEVLTPAERSQAPFGKGSHSILYPFVSIAANDLPRGQTVYLPELDGLDLGHMTHNGCVRVDDKGWSFRGCQIDLFVVSYVDFLWLGLEDEHVSPRIKDCEVLNYVSPGHLAFINSSPLAPH